MSINCGELQEVFEQYDLPELDTNAAKKAVAVCNKYELSADQFAAKCELIIVKKGNNGAITSKDIGNLEKQVQQQYQKRQQKYQSRTSTKNKTPRRRSMATVDMNRESLSSLDALSQVLSVKAERAEGIYMTPVKDHGTPGSGGPGLYKRRKIQTPSFHSPNILASPPSASFQSRANIGKVMVTYNKDLEASKNGVKQTVGDIPVTINDTHTDRKFRYMFDDLEEKSENLNSGVSFMLRALEEQLPLTDHCKGLDQNEIQFSPVNFPTQKSAFIGGRIICDAEGKLNPNSVELEGDRVISAGNKIKLDISKLQEYAFFPNQVVALEGLNPSGQRFVATKAFQPQWRKEEEEGKTKQASKSVQQLLKDTQTLEKRPTSVMVATGPYTTAENMLYWPLTALLETVEQKRPDVLVLAGPFVDHKHKDVCLGNVSTTFEAQYESVVHTVEQRLRGLGIQILMLPSPEDAFHHPVVPQPCARAESQESIRFLPNPAQFKVNDVTFGIVNTDILKHLSKQEISRKAPGAKGGSRLIRLASHLISQRNFYPLFPPAKGVNVDYSHPEMLRMHVRPDVLITPGDLNYFASKTQDGESVCLNPGRLSKGNSGGTYAMVTIHGLKGKPTDEGFDRSAADRIRVDVLRI